MESQIQTLQLATLNALRLLLVGGASIVGGPLVGYLAARAVVDTLSSGSAGVAILAYLGAPALAAGALALLLRFRWFALAAALVSSASAFAVAAYVLSHLNLQL